MQLTEDLYIFKTNALNWTQVIRKIDSRNSMYCFAIEIEKRYFVKDEQILIQIK